MSRKQVVAMARTYDGRTVPVPGHLRGGTFYPGPPVPYPLHVSRTGEPLLDRDEFIQLELQAYRREREGRLTTSELEQERRYLQTAPLPTMRFQLDQYKGLPACTSRILALMTDDEDERDLMLPKSEKAATGKVKAKASPGKAKATPPPPPELKTKPKTYPAAVFALVTAHGMLSRAALTKECSTIGFDKAAPLKQALSKLLKEGKIVLDGGSYILGAGERANAGSAYEKALKHATGARSDKAIAKEKGRMRAEKAYAKNFKKAVKGTVGETVARGLF